ncbi:Uncharacterised protein [Bordetella pertussis]|nr:Uncharacterised protein [Bordetella pertussis]CFW37650.1 Uncharacterised protein [Bordetella pertussis]
MITAPGGFWHSASARSSRGLYATTLPAREPPSVLMTTLGAASSMRWARLTEAKPPNTTEWMAPMRAHASMANTASGTMGMYSTAPGRPAPPPARAAWPPRR